jgi:hypothetical protein
VRRLRGCCGGKSAWGCLSVVGKQDSEALTIGVVSLLKKQIISHH